MTTLLWDIGTAYDFFISLHILHHPADYNLRKAWAKGVRARLSPQNRETLERVASHILLPIHWIPQLPAPKDGQTILDSLAALPPEQRLAAVSLPEMTADNIRALLMRVSADKGYQDEDIDVLTASNFVYFGKKLRREKAIQLLELWSWNEQFGEAYLAAIQEYYDVFWSEEELRIAPSLESALAWAQNLATTHDFSSLMEELSQGVRLVEPVTEAEILIAPSFWSTPLIIGGKLNETQRVIVFGARPTSLSLVPGDVVPDALHQALKALADPTRLRILRYLSKEPHTPAELARRLRLRPPTVSHHLHTLRLARLVQFTLDLGDKRRYTIRREAVTSTFANLDDFLNE